MGFLTYLMGLSGLAGAIILYCRNSLSWLEGKYRSQSNYSGGRTDRQPYLLEHLLVVSTPISRRATFSLWMETVWLMWLI